MPPEADRRLQSPQPVVPLDESATARGDLKYRDQLFDAAASVEANIAEGFGRYTPGQFVVFLRYALASLAECRTRLQDGVDRGHFRAADVERAIDYAARCEAATRALRASQHRLVEQRRKGPRPAG